MAEVSYIEWHVHPARADRWFEAWLPGAERALSFGAKSWSLTRSIDDPLHFRQAIVWDNHDDFDRYWYSDEIAALREEVMNLYNKPLVISWHALSATSERTETEATPEQEPEAATAE